MKRFTTVAAMAISMLLLAACSQQPTKSLSHSSKATLIPEPSATAEDSLQAGDAEFSIPPLESPSSLLVKPSFQSDNLWNRLFAMYQLPILDHPRIDRELRWYARHPEYIERVQARAKPYLYTIVDEIERAGAPGELALLPVVESAFKPRAYSHQRAAGLWQFIPSTGRLYGLEQNWWVDLRNDVHASTRAAIKYLKKLNRDFDGDWLLALAAYNAGEGAVRRAIRRNLRHHKPTDFWHLRLPRETRAYVPKLLAVARLFANAKDYGIRLQPIPNHPLYAEVNVDSQLDLLIAAELAEMQVEELYRLNPGFKRWATAPEGPHRLVLPLEKVDLFKQNLAELPKHKRVQWRRHKVRRGETLSHIAKRYKTPVQVIRTANHLRGSVIRTGQTLVIPVADERHLKFALAHAQKILPVLEARHPQVIRHTVRRGDSLWEIARRYGVRVRQLAQWNGISSRATLKPGQRLIVHSEQASVHQRNRGGTRKTIIYKVKKGDSLSRIAKRFRVSIKDLRSWNQQQVGDTLRPGQRLKVFVKAAVST